MPTAEHPSKKICVVCGKDVAGQPRVKDAAGHYMCAGECQQRAAAKAKARQAAPPPVPTPEKTSPPPAAAVGGSLLANLIDDSPMMKTAKCEACANPMPGGAVICTRCGFNTQTGKAMKTAVIVEREPKAAKVPRRYRAEFGPSFGVLFLIGVAVMGGLGLLGFVHIGFAGLGLLLAIVVFFVGYIWGIVAAFMEGETTWGICGILSFFFWVPLIGFIYYMFAECENKWAKSIFLSSLLSALLSAFVIYNQADSFKNAFNP